MKALKPTFYTVELHTIILYIIFLPKHCRLFLSTKDLFVLIAKKNRKLRRDNGLFKWQDVRAKMPYFFEMQIGSIFFNMTVALSFDQL